MAIEKYNLNFLVLGERSSGKTNLIFRIADNTYSERYHVEGADYKLITVESENKEVECGLYDDDSRGKKSYNWVGTLSKMKGVLLTVDMTDANALAKAKDWIDLIKRHGKQGTPIIIVGTKADDKSNQRITQSELVNFVQSYSGTEAPVFGPLITSAKCAIETNNFLTSIAEMVIENNPTLKSQRATRSDTIKTEILPELETYTSGFNKFLAYLKAIFSLGRFTLGVEKQNMAEDLKVKLNKPDANACQLVEEYKQKNEKLVSDEIRSSNLFVKPYIKQEPSGEVKRNEGDLGEILNKYSPSGKK